MTMLFFTSHAFPILTPEPMLVEGLM